MADIKMKNIVKKYISDDYEIIAVSNFNLEVKSGESIVFLGPSGCGKTTTLRMIAGLETISEGELYIDGKLSNDILPNDRHISMVFHDYALFPHMTVFENLAFGFMTCDLSEDEIKEKVEEIARIMDITHLLERKPRQLSAGQRQRVAIGRAVIGDNEIVLLDEPFSNFDARLRFWMRTELIKIHNIVGKTFIYVTHDCAEAMALADRIVVMKDGIIQQVGTPKELYSSPVNIFVAGLMGFPQMNFINASLTECDGSVFVSWGDNKIKLPCFNEAAKKYIGEDVLAGIRPEHIYIDEANIAKYNDSLLEVNVNTVEFYGLTTYIRLGENELLASIPEEYNVNVKMGDKIKVAFNPDKIYLFDNDTENIIDYK